MKRTHFAQLLTIFVFSLILFGCTSNSQSVSKPATEAHQSQPTESRPTTAAEVFTQAEENQNKTKGLSFQIKGKETLTIKASGAQQRVSADYKAKVNVVMNPHSLYSTGTITSKGKNKAEQIYVVGEDVYVKVGTNPWTKGKISDPTMKGTVEDPTQSWKELQELAQKQPDLFTMTPENGTYMIDVALTNEQYKTLANTEVIKKIKIELNSTLSQLKKLGYKVNANQIQLAHYKDSIVLDEKTFQLKKRSVLFQLIIPAGKQTFTYEQKLEIETLGSYEGNILLPSQVKKSASSR